MVTVPMLMVPRSGSDSMVGCEVRIISATVPSSLLMSCRCCLSTIFSRS